MHHMGVYEMYVVLKDSEQLAQKIIAKVKYDSLTFIPAGKQKWRPQNFSLL